MDTPQPNRKRPRSPTPPPVADDEVEALINNDEKPSRVILTAQQKRIRYLEVSRCLKYNPVELTFGLGDESKAK
jgi:hypothetical protein